MTDVGRPLHELKSNSHSSVKMFRYRPQSRWSMPAAYPYETCTMAAASVGSMIGAFVLTTAP